VDKAERLYRGAVAASASWRNSSHATDATVSNLEVYMRWHLLVVTLLTAAVAGVAIPATAHADSYRSRAERWEFTIEMRYVDDQTFDHAAGTQVDVKSEVGWGFGFAYNFNDHLALGMDFGWNSPSYDATVVTDNGSTYQVGTEMSTSSFHLNLLYNFIAGPVTPFVGAGIGSTYIDTNIPAGPAGTSCYWDPWYGYICYGYQPTYGDSRFSYNALVGVRWDINRDVFLRAAVGSHWIDAATGGDQDFTVGRLEIGFSY
jgi:opacity protein-like surface antigen